MPTLLGVDDSDDNDGGGALCTCGAEHGHHHPTCAAMNPHAMTNDAGDVFYPDGPDDAEHFRVHHDARPAHPHRWPWP